MEKRTEVYQVRLSKKEKAELEESAKEGDTLLSRIIRIGALKEAKRIIKISKTMKAMKKREPIILERMKDYEINGLNSCLTDEEFQEAINKRRLKDIEKNK